MKNYQPTLGIKETAQNIKFFREANMATFWRIYKPLLPYILALHFLDAVISDLYFPESEGGFGLGAFISVYFVTVLVISWHRVVIQGPDDFKPMNPFRPQKHEWVFIGVGVLLGLGMAFVTISTAFAAIYSDQKALIFVSFFIIFLGVYVIYRLSFYFPAKAVNANMTLGQAFRLSKGYLWKLIASSFLASIRFVLLYVCLMLAAMTVLFGLMTVTGPGFAHTLGFFLFGIPSAVYFEPLLTIIGVTALSNYYLYAMQNEDRASAISV